MTSTDFPQSNKVFGPPAGMTEEQVRSMPAYVGETQVGSCDGSTCVIVAWQPDDREREAIANGSPIFLTCIGSLPPHFLTTNFAEANNPA
jgi:hypothetical protein